MKILRNIFVVILIPLLFSCSSALEDYQGSTPKFELENYFNSEVTAWGIVQDYSTKLTRRFCVDIVGTWEGNQGQLDETFYYHDGEQQTRIWSLSKDQKGNVTGTARDVIGQAQGSEVGSAFNWKYTLRVPVGDTTYDFAVDDWMYKLDENRVMNRSYMKKLGITVAEISIFFDKTPPIRKCTANTK